jgi:hypothetical protein
MTRFATAIAALALALAAAPAEAGIRKAGFFPYPTIGAEAPTQTADASSLDRVSAEDRR